MEMNTVPTTQNKSKSRFMSRIFKTLKHIKKDRQLLLIFLPCIIYYGLFKYGPMYGIIIAFKKFGLYTGIMKSPWVGFKYFEQFFTSEDFFLLLRNTFLLGINTLFWGFPVPIIFALFLNELTNRRLKKLVQTVSFLPSFLSIVIIASMVVDLLSPSHGLINTFISLLGFEKVYFMIKPEWFRTVYVASGIWQNMGHNAIYYIAAITAIDTTLYEAGKVDGCSRLRAIWNITLPGIMPTVTTLLILRTGRIFSIGFEKVLLLYNPVTYEVADVFSTYVYRKGLVESNYSYAAAVGLFESVVALALLLITNTVSRRLSEQSLW